MNSSDRYREIEAARLILDATLAMGHGEKETALILLLLERAKDHLDRATRESDKALVR